MHVACDCTTEFRHMVYINHSQQQNWIMCYHHYTSGSKQCNAKHDQVSSSIYVHCTTHPQIYHHTLGLLLLVTPVCFWFSVFFEKGQMDVWGKLQDRVLSKGLRERLGLDDIISVLQQNRL